MDTLDQKLVEYWLQQETVKTFSQWLQWCKQHKMNFQTSSDNLHDPQTIPYHQFLAQIQNELVLKPEWAMLLNSPTWFMAQKIIVFPKLWSGNKHPLSVQQKLEMLALEIGQLKQRVIRLESNVPHAEDSAANYRQTEKKNKMPVTSLLETADGDKISFERANVLQKELTLMFQSSKVKVPDESESPKPSIMPKPLEDVYLPFNDWLRQMALRNFDLQPFATQPLEVASSHRISFPQFVKRVSLVIENQEDFLSTVLAFNERYQDSFIPKVEEPQLKAEMQPVDLTISNYKGVIQVSVENPPAPPQTMPFKAPDLDDYRDYNSWIEWLQQQNIDPTEYADQDIRVNSSHRISFQQFCVRLERVLRDPAGFRERLAK